MERYEVKVKYEEIKELMKAEWYQDAMEVANTIDWDKSKNVNMLCLAGEVYERCGMFEDSKAIYLRAYQLQPQSRIIIYRLAELSIKLNDYEDSIHFYKEYEKAAPYDINLYVLRYKIYVASGASTETLISILEELKESDYHERWAYELAKLYGEAGMIDKCVAECDEINLWFGTGRYVLKALQLKKKYQPLTGEQQQKLDNAAPKPHKAEETIQKKAEAEEKKKRAQKNFEDLKTKGRKAGTGNLPSYAELEKARKDALDAAREEKAAQLLWEAEAENDQEEAAIQAREESEYIGQGTMPQFNAEISEKIKAPAMKTPQIKAPRIKQPVNAPTAESARNEAAEPAKNHAAESTAKLAEPARNETVEPAAEPKNHAAEPAAETQRPAQTGEPDAADAAARETARSERQTIEIPVLQGKKGFSPLKNADKKQESGQTVTQSDEPTESDILAQNIALALEGKLPLQRTPKKYEDDFIHTTSVDEYIKKDFNDEGTFVGNLDDLDEQEPEEPVEEDYAFSEEAGEALEDLPEEDTEDFVDDYEQDNPPEDDSTPEDDASFEKKESAFRRVWRMTSNAVSRKPKAATVIAREQDYDVQIKPVVVSRYDTINLQKELARSIRAIMNATEKEEVEETINTINRTMEQSNIPKLIQTKRLHIQEVKEALEQEEQAEKEKADSLEAEAKALEEKMQNLLGEEYDGQLRLNVEETKPQEKQITGQLSIEELLQAERRKQLDEVKKKALEQAEEYIDQLSVVVPYIGDREEVEVEMTPPQESTTGLLEEAQRVMESSIESKTDLEDVIAKLSSLLQKSNDTAEPAAAEPEAETEPAAEAEPVAAEVEPAAEAEPAAEEEPAAEAAEPAAETEPAAEAEPVAEEEPAAAEAEPAAAEAEPAAEEELAEAEAEPVAEATDNGGTHVIDEEQKKILSYFMKFSGVENEITAFLEREQDHGENFVITGTEGSGKTSLALRLMKSLAKVNDDIPKKIAKLPASSLNKKPVDTIFAKIGEGTLLIEHAEDLEPETREELVKMLDAYARKIRVILIGDQAPVEQMLEDGSGLSKYFSYCFHLHEYNNNELVEFAKAYAETLGYKIDEMAILALYTRLAGAKTKKQAVMLGDVKTIVNEAITANENRKGVKSFLENLLMKNVDSDGNLILRESDFEVK